LNAAATHRAARPVARLSVVIVVAVLAAVAAALVWHGVAHRIGLARYDQDVTTWAVAHRNPVMDVVMRTVTFLAGTPAVVVLALLAALWLRRRTGAWTWPVIVLGAVAVQAVLAAALKSLTARPRPALALELGAPARTFAFPSGHTLAGGTLCLTLALAVVMTTARWSVRVLAGALAIVATVAVAASRVYLGYHWLTDVAASGLLAVVITALAATVALLLPVRAAPARVGPARGAGHPVVAAERVGHPEGEQGAPPWAREKGRR
jgi:membrane-associated phospholipid phosphatase